jgi:hypothetical protein
MPDLFTPDFEIFSCLFPEKCAEEDMPCLWCVEIDPNMSNEEIEAFIIKARNNVKTNN